MRNDNVILIKSMNFAVRIVKLYQHLVDEKHEYVMSKQLLRSGTSIGANIREAIQAQSRKDFVSKMNISLKEACETEYWLELMYRTQYLTETEYTSIQTDCKEITKILNAIVKNSK